MTVAPGGPAWVFNVESWPLHPDASVGMVTYINMTNKNTGCHDIAKYSCQELNQVPLTAYIQRIYKKTFAYVF
ncbi:hypothetical protein ACKA06_10670 [Rossellomorea oryzaecorticis]|uniref:Uncharacterized protein n=1 Tax=Rossellomorea oryzaecorticis TaxID=1396505 RepID=A0ABW8VPC9_9BACI